MPDTESAPGAELSERLERLERVLGLQTLAADEEAAGPACGPGNSSQSINCNSVRSCASIICAAGGGKLVPI